MSSPGISLWRGITIWTPDIPLWRVLRYGLLISHYDVLLRYGLLISHYDVYYDMGSWYLIMTCYYDRGSWYLIMTWYYDICPLISCDGVLWYCSLIPRYNASLWESHCILPQLYIESAEYFSSKRK
jgi:hypothetical protein